MQLFQICISLLCLLPSIVIANFNCSISNNCTYNTYTCSQNKNCIINCFGDNVCFNSVFHCPDNFNCIVNVYGVNNISSWNHNGMAGSTVYGGNNGNLIIRCSGGRHACARTKIYCPKYGICDISLVDNLCYQCLLMSQIVTENTTRLLYIHNDGNTATYVLQNTVIYCPPSVNQQSKCIINLQGYGQAKLWKTNIYAVDSFNDVLLTCTSYCDGKPKMYCGDASNRSVCAMIQTSDSDHEWICKDTPSKCDRDKKISSDTNSICSVADAGFVNTQYQLSLTTQACLDGISLVISKLIHVIDVIYHNNQLFVHSNITQTQKNEITFLEETTYECENISVSVQILTCFDDTIDATKLLNITNSNQFEQDINDNINLNSTIVFIYVQNTSIIYINNPKHWMNIYIFIYVFVGVALCTCFVAIVCTLILNQMKHKLDRYNEGKIIRNAMVILICVADYDDNDQDLPIEKDIQNLNELFGPKNLNYTVYSQNSKSYWTQKQILDLLNKKAAEFDTSKEFDALIFIFSGHGMKGSIYTSDDQLIQQYAIHRMFTKNYCSARKRPRIFLFDCCAGSNEYECRKQSTIESSAFSKKIKYYEKLEQNDMDDHDTKEVGKHFTESEIQSKNQIWPRNELNPDANLVHIQAANSGFQSKCNVMYGSYMISYFVDKIKHDLRRNGKHTQKYLKEIMDEIEVLLHSKSKKQLPLVTYTGNTANVIFEKKMTVINYEVQKQLTSGINIELNAINAIDTNDVLQTSSPNNRTGRSELKNIQNSECV
eukprot:142285_1